MAKRRKMDRSFLARGANAPVTTKSSAENNKSPDSPRYGVFQDAQTLRVSFPFLEDATGVQVFDLGTWQILPNIGPAFADAFYAYGRSLAPATRIRTKYLADNFFRFLQKYVEKEREQVTLGEIDKSMINAYIVWVNEQRNQVGQPWALGTKEQVLSVFRQLLRALKNLESYREMVRPDLSVRRHEWSVRRSSPKLVLSVDKLRLIDHVCAEEMVDAMERRRRGQELVAAYYDQAVTEPKGQTDYHDLGVCLATVARLFPDTIPPRHEMIETNRLLAGAIQRYFGHANIISYFHPRPRTLIPFVVALGLRTAFNPDTLLNLTLSQIRTSWFFGKDRVDVDPLLSQERLQVIGKKRRSGRDQVRSFPARGTDISSPAVIFENVEQLTSRLRPHARPQWEDRLFMFVPLRRRNVKAFSNNKSGVSSSDSSWQRGLKKFIQDNDLPAFTLSDLRATVGDLIHDITRGDVKAQQLILGHRHPQVTDEHYTSDGARRRQNEQLATVQNQQVRWVETDGKRDIRGERGHSTQKAVTPGFECFDPYGSPQVGQTQGKLCNAYLACPLCPLAAVDTQDPVVFATLVNLGQTLADAHTELEPVRYAREIAPTANAVAEEWLPRFTDPAVWDAAKQVEQVPQIVVE